MIQPSLRIHGALVPGAPANTKTQGCSSPLYEMTQYSRLQGIRGWSNPRIRNPQRAFCTLKLYVRVCRGVGAHNKTTCECLSPWPVLTKLYYSFNGVMIKSRNQNTWGSQRLLCLLCRTDSDNPLEKYFQRASDSKYNHRQQLYMKNKVRRRSKKQGESQLQFNVLILFSCTHT